MASRMYDRKTGEAVWVHLFTGGKLNREPTREFVGNPKIIIREGKFMHEFVKGKVGYVVAGEWIVKHDDGRLVNYPAEQLHKLYNSRSGK